MAAGTADVRAALPPRARRGAGRLRGAPGRRSGTCPRTPSGVTSPTPSCCSTTWPVAAAQQVHDLDLRHPAQLARAGPHPRPQPGHDGPPRGVRPVVHRLAAPRRPDPRGRRPAAGQPQGAPHAARRARARPGAGGRRVARPGPRSRPGCATPSSSSCSTPAASGSASWSGSTSTTSTGAAGCCGCSARGARSAACPTACRPSAAIDAWLTRGRPALATPDVRAGPAARASAAHRLDAREARRVVHARRRRGPRSARHRPARAAALGRDARAGGRRRPPVRPGVARAR